MKQFGWVGGWWRSGDGRVGESVGGAMGDGGENGDGVGLLLFLVHSFWLCTLGSRRGGWQEGTSYLPQAAHVTTRMMIPAGSIKFVPFEVLGDVLGGGFGLCLDEKLRFCAGWAFSISVVFCVYCVFSRSSF